MQARDRKWRKAMMKAIKRAAADTGLFKGSSKANGLRAIKVFEEVNGRAFDPFDDYHCEIVHGMGVHAGLHRRIRLMRTRGERNAR